VTSRRRLRGQVLVGVATVLLVSLLLPGALGASPRTPTVTTFRAPYTGATWTVGGDNFSFGCTSIAVPTNPSFVPASGDGVGGAGSTAQSCTSSNGNPAGFQQAGISQSVIVSLPVNDSLGGHFRVHAQLQPSSTWSLTAGTCHLNPGATGSQLCSVSSDWSVSAFAQLWENGPHGGRQTAFSVNWDAYGETSDAQYCSSGATNCTTTTVTPFNGSTSTTFLPTLYLNASLLRGHIYTLQVYFDVSDGSTVQFTYGTDSITGASTSVTTTLRSDLVSISEN
jgi:hypothetical protein